MISSPNFPPSWRSLGDGRGCHEPRNALQRHDCLLRGLVHAGGKLGQDLVVSHACSA